MYIVFEWKTTNDWEKIYIYIFFFFLNHEGACDKKGVGILLRHHLAKWMTGSVWREKETWGWRRQWTGNLNKGRSEK